MPKSRNEVIFNIGGKSYISTYQEGGDCKVPVEVTMLANGGWSITNIHAETPITGKFFYNAEVIIALIDYYKRKAGLINDGKPIPEVGTLTHNAYDTKDSLTSTKVFEHWAVKNDIASAKAKEGEEEATLEVVLSANGVISIDRVSAV